MEKRLIKKREKRERQNWRETREKGALRVRRSMSRSRSTVGWLQRAARGGSGGGAKGGRGAWRGGERSGGSGLQHADIPYLSLGHEDGITSESDTDTRKWKDAERKKKKKEEQKREKMEGCR